MIKHLPFLLGFIVSYSFSQEIKSIHFEDLKRTKSDFLARCIDLNSGDVFDEEEIKKNAQHLRNLNLFLTVEYRIVDIDSVSKAVYYTIEEANYTYPIFSFGGFDEKLNLTLGAGDNNFSGKAQSIGFLYQFYDRHSFKFYHNSMFLGKTKFGHELAIGKQSTLEPLYFGNTTSLFNFDNYHLSVGTYYWLSRNLKVGVGGMLMYENYKNRGIDLSMNGMEINFNDQFNFFKFQVRSVIHYNKLNYLYERRFGIQNTLFAETIQTEGYPLASFFKASNDFKYHQLIGKSGNLNFRNRIGLATNNDSPFSPFVIDGFINVRGSGDRVARGTGELIFNIEYVHTILRHKWFYCMLNAFSDIGYLRAPGKGIMEMFEQQNAYYFSGVGVRFHSRKLYNSLIRIDYGFNLQNTTQNGLIFGFGHFF